MSKIWKFFQGIAWAMSGRCSECGSDNIYVWSVRKAECTDCGAQNQ